MAKEYKNLVKQAKERMKCYWTQVISERDEDILKAESEGKDAVAVAEMHKRRVRQQLMSSQEAIEREEAEYRLVKLAIESPDVVDVSMVLVLAGQDYMDAPTAEAKQRVLLNASARLRKYKERYAKENGVR